MYTSNMIFYTVDYNHVQSELNFKVYEAYK